MAESGFAGLLARHRSDVGNVPANTAERFHHRDDHYDKEPEMDERRDEKPHARERPAGKRDRQENHAQDPGRQVEEKPDAAKDDRLHGVEADELVVLLADVKNEPADEWNAGERGRDVRGQSRRGGGIYTWARAGTGGRNRGRVDWI